MDKKLDSVPQVLKNPPGNVLILEAKKRGRPRRENEQAAETEKPSKKQKLSAEKAASKSSREKSLTTDDKVKSILAADVLRIKGWLKIFEVDSVKQNAFEWTPGYKFCKLYSCFWCQEFSWDTKRCSNCKRIIPEGTRFLNVENSETVDQIVDTARPIFHPPPVPYYRAGEVVFCTSCFYTSHSHKNCDICGSKILLNQVLHIQFVTVQKFAAEEVGKMVLPFKARKIGTCFIECPNCFLSTSPGCDSCVHCNSTLPKFVVISTGSKSNDIFNLKWPIKSELLDGTIKTPPPNYVPVFKENMLATCPWCLSLSFDIFRCSSCMRQFPKNKNLVALQADSMYGIGYGPAKPNYDPTPVPNFKPGKMSVCHECKKYSKNLRQCEYCGEKQRNYVAVFVSFKSVKLSQDSSKETLVPYTPRMVNNLYFVCPQCERTTDKQKCIHCGLHIPSMVKVTELSKAAARKGRNLQGKIIPGNFKVDSLSREDSLINCGTITKKDRQEEAADLPKGYEPRFREKGVVQCESCLNWSWDFNRCSKCHSIILPTSLAIFPKTSVRHPAFEETRPTLTSPVPSMRLGVVAFCSSCLSFVTSAPKCTECFKRLENTTYLVEALEITEAPGANCVKFLPRMLANKSMAFCLFCGFSTSNHKVCTFCSKAAPQFCKVTPTDPTKSLPRELDFAQLQVNRETEQVAFSENLTAADDAVEADLVVIHDWKAAVCFKEKNRTKEFLESIPYGVKIDAFYDHQLSCFPDEIFEMSQRS